VDFFSLSAEARQLVQLRIQVADAVRRRRRKLGLTQAEFAARLKSSQSRVAKIEAAAADVSLDLAFRALFAAGGGLRDVHAAGLRRAASARPRPQPKAGLGSRGKKQARPYPQKY
jgi:transcriptional regulator with XRE-family HTH domain